MAPVQNEVRVSHLRTANGIRKANEGDSAGILECLRMAFEPYRQQYSPEAFADTTLSPDTLRNRFSTMSILVAIAEDQVVGTVAWNIVGDREGHIRGMAVLPAWQGRGIAEQLLEAVEFELRGRSCSRITLDTTEPLRAAIRFYEKNGFRKTGKIRDFFGMPLLEYVRNLL
jgi:ribosomal protein S18 acetylase RimI-like enzyme